MPNERFNQNEPVYCWFCRGDFLGRLHYGYLSVSGVPIPACEACVRKQNPRLDVERWVRDARAHAVKCFRRRARVHLSAVFASMRTAAT